MKPPYRPPLWMWVAAVAFWLGVLWAGWSWVTRTDCDTDAECAALPRCRLAPDCDGGSPRHNPRRPRA